MRVSGSATRGEKKVCLSEQKQSSQVKISLEMKKEKRLTDKMIRNIKTYRFIPEEDLCI